jgi:protein gp37
MADKTKIEWADASWNPVTGCTKVSPGCKYCYAERQWPRLSGNPKTRYSGRAFTNVACHPDVLAQPLRWRRERRVFVNSMSDLFHEAIPNAFIDRVFAIMLACAVLKGRNHQFQILTKRPARMLAYFESRTPAEHIRAWAEAGNALVVMNGSGSLLDEYLIGQMKNVWPLPNVHLGVSAENQTEAIRRIPPLLLTPAKVRWLSAEPLLGPLNLGFALNRGLDWVVVGGETGPHARPMHPDWVRSIRDQCRGSGVAFFFKQWGEWAPAVDKPIRGKPTGGDLLLLRDGTSGNQADWWNGDAEAIDRLGKKRAGRLLDGRLWDEYPERMDQPKEIRL